MTPQNSNEPTAFSPGDRTTVSVCIPAFNEGAALVRLVSYLQTLIWSGGVIAEIIVDISGSTDSTRELLEACSGKEPLLKIIDSGVRDGLVRSLNRLIRAATSDVVVRMDADVALNPETIPRVVEALSSGGHVLAGPRIVPVVLPSGLVSKMVTAEYVFHDQICRESPKTTVLQAFQRVPVVLPEDAVVEDVALQFELEGLHYDVRYVPEVTVCIYGPQTLRDYLAQRIRTIRALRWFERKYGAKPSTAEPTLFLRAMRSALVAGQVKVPDMLAFLVVEALCRLSAAFLVTAGPPTTWVPVQSTKPDYHSFRR